MADNMTKELSGQMAGCERCINAQVFSLKGSVVFYIKSGMEFKNHHQIEVRSVARNFIKVQMAASLGKAICEVSV